jgi:hypothetical protein
MSNRFSGKPVMLAVCAASLVGPIAAQVRARAAGPHPDFQGIWNSASAIPLERPAKLKDKAFFTKEEAADWERQAAARREEPAPEVKAKTFGSYNTVFYETGTKVFRNLRTSIITDPPDGRLPALLPAAAAEKARRVDLLKHAQIPAEMGLQDRCIAFIAAVPPMLPYIYNSNYQFVQTGHDLMINVEMIHDSRIIRMDRQAHLPPSIQLWLGDSVGHWEGDTLVVDSTNFKDGGGYFGDAGGMFGTDRNLHVVERFSLLDANTMMYRFEVDDSTAFTRPWKGELTMSRSPGPIYEYACHEGNYALPNLLNIFRKADAPANK